ncbi:hypothetical protein D3C76_253430 [compost metagenome]
MHDNREGSTGHRFRRQLLLAPDDLNAVKASGVFIAVDFDRHAQDGVLQVDRIILRGQGHARHLEVLRQRAQGDVQCCGNRQPTLVARFVQQVIDDVEATVSQISDHLFRDEDGSGCRHGLAMGRVVVYRAILRPFAEVEDLVDVTGGTEGVRGQGAEDSFIVEQVLFIDDRAGELHGGRLVVKPPGRQAVADQFDRRGAGVAGVIDFVISNKQWAIGYQFNYWNTQA